MSLNSDPLPVKSIKRNPCHGTPCVQVGQLPGVALARCNMISITIASQPASRQSTAQLVHFKCRWCTAQFLPGKRATDDSLDCRKRFTVDTFLSWSTDCILPSNSGLASAGNFCLITIAAEVVNIQGVGFHSFGHFSRQHWKATTRSSCFTNGPSTTPHCAKLQVASRLPLGLHFQFCAGMKFRVCGRRPGFSYDCFATSPCWRGIKRSAKGHSGCLNLESNDPSFSKRPAHPKMHLGGIRFTNVELC